MFEIRPALENDSAAIHSLIHQVQINPMDLDWHHFLVAVTPEGDLIGCGQVKGHRDGSSELASIAVVPDWRRQGVARAIILALLENHPGRLYLTCRASLGQFYEKFGFRVVSDRDMPPYFRQIKRLFRVLTKVKKAEDDLLVMVREAG